MWKSKRKSWLWKRMGTLMPPHPLTNFEIQKYYQNEPIFNGVYSRDNLPKKIINLVKYLDICFVKEEKLFISIDLVLNMFLKKSKNLSGKKKSKPILFEYKQTIRWCVGTFAWDSLILGLGVKNWLILFSPYDFAKNDSIIFSYFKDEWMKFCWN